MEVPERIGVVVSSVKREIIHWLWTGWLAFRKIAILDGDPGVGKSTLWVYLVALFTTGRAFPGSTGPNEAGNVLIITVEDGVADTIRPRLEAAGADLHRVTVLQSFKILDERTGHIIDRIPTLPSDLLTIEQALWESDARLVIIDPLMAHLDADINSYRDQDVRRALAPLATLADKLDVAVIVVRHLTKMPGGNPLYRGGGSIGIIGAARLGMLLAKDPEDEDALVLANTKSNLGRRPQSQSLRIAASDYDPNVGVVQWVGESKHTAAELLNQPKTRETPERSRASEWLLQQLADGDPRPASEMWEMAKKEGLSKKTVYRAKVELGVISARLGGLADQGAWYWSLPATKVVTATENSQDKGDHGALYTNGMATLVTHTPSSRLKEDIDGHLSSKENELPL